MGALAKKLRKAREMSIVVGAFTFLARRPTDLEMIALRGQISGEEVLRFLTGWENVTEADIVPNGDPFEAPFDREDAREWLSDRPDLFAEILKGLSTGYQAHVDDLEERLKNLTPGSIPAIRDSSQALTQ